MAWGKKKSSEFNLTHQAPANRFSLSSRMVSVEACIFGFVTHVRTDRRTDGCTDTMYKNNDHLFGQVGQKEMKEEKANERGGRVISEHWSNNFEALIRSERCM